MLATLRDGRLALLRPVLRRDEAALQAFVRGLSPWTRHARFFAPVRELTVGQLERLFGSGERGGIALAALRTDTAAGEIVGLAEYAPDEGAGAEFAVVVADAWQRAGLGATLTEALAARARRAGYARLSGVVLDANLPMLSLAAKLGFSHGPCAEPGTLLVQRALAGAAGLEAA